MWKIYHKLFGWDYILVGHGYSKYVVRVRKTPSGQLYYKLYGFQHLHIEKAKNIVWLTCSITKYYPFLK